jgi:predicted nucleotidyltransferase
MARERTTHDVPVPGDVAQGELIRVLVGSTLYGTGLPGQEDTDLMGVCVEPWEAVVGLRRFDQWSWRTQPEGVRSGPGDIDITIYGLRKFLHLATKGNPSILLLLFVPPEHVEHQTEWGMALQALVPAIVSKQVAAPYLGYCTAQRQRLEGIRGGAHTNRPELVEQFGYDTKYAMHAMRLALQGQEILTTGRVVVPIIEHGDYLRSIRHGEVPYDDVIARLREEEDGLRAAELASPLRDHPDLDIINDFMRAAYYAHIYDGRT